MQSWVSLKVSSNAKEVAKRMEERAIKVQKQGKTTTLQIAQETRDRIMSLMPKETRQSADSIGYVLTTSDKNYTSVKVGIMGMPHPEKTWHGTWFNLPWYMFEGKGALSQHFHSGNIPMLRMVPKQVRSEYKRRIEVDMSQILK